RLECLRWTQVQEWFVLLCGSTKKAKPIEYLFKRLIRPRQTTQRNKYLKWRNWKFLPVIGLHNFFNNTTRFPCLRIASSTT
ncbi:hypothetical protein TELCIR_23681, partial [Teladorsagia circumcincta]